MTTIDHFNLRNFDLNLLIAFDAMMEELNVTRAAARLKIQQPAMSHSLKTLRMLFGDPLFVRIGQSMQPTSRARSLSLRIRPVLQKAEDALAFTEEFDATTAQRLFRIGCSSELAVHLLPMLMVDLQRNAPGIKIIARHVEGKNIRAVLDGDEIDLAVGCFGEQGQWHSSETLFNEQLICCFNPKLLPFSTPIGQQDYLSQPHALISFNETLMGCIEGAFNRAGATLNAIFAAPNFLTLLSFAEHSPVLVTLPKRIAQRYSAAFNLACSPVPLELEEFPNVLVWPAYADSDPAIMWLRDKISCVIKTIETTL